MHNGVNSLGATFGTLHQPALIAPLLASVHTAGFAIDDNLGRRRHSGCWCPISITRPHLETRQKTTQGTFDNFLQNCYCGGGRVSAKSHVSRLILGGYRDFYAILWITVKLVRASCRSEHLRERTSDQRYLTDDDRARCRARKCKIDRDKWSIVTVSHYEVLRE